MDAASLAIGAAAGLALGAGAAWALLAPRAARLGAERDALEARLEAERRAWEAQRAEDKEVRRAEFENLANRIFESKQAQAEKQIGSLVTPIRESIERDIRQFREKVDQHFGQEGRDRASLKTHIEHILQASVDLRLETQGLTKALKGDTKVQGDWGEKMLEKILEEAGLRPGLDYALQSSFQGEGGERLRPDAIVHLPRGRHIVIDAKVSLAHATAYFEAQDDVARDAARAALLASFRRHIGALADKRYDQRPGASDFTLMFVPVEGAYTLAIQANPGLFDEAWKKKVILVCPANLFAVLRTVASVRDLEIQNKNVEEIKRLGGRIYDKVCGFMEAMGGVEKGLDGARKAYGEALGRLQGHGGVLALAERMKAMRIQTTKTLPEAAGLFLPSEEGVDGVGEDGGPGGQDGSEGDGEEGQGEE